MQDLASVQEQLERMARENAAYQDEIRHLLSEKMKLQVTRLLYVKKLSGNTKLHHKFYHLLHEPNFMGSNFSYLTENIGQLSFINLSLKV